MYIGVYMVIKVYKGVYKGYNMMGIHYDLLHAPCYECLRLAWGGLVCRVRRRSKGLEPHSRPKREGERRKKEGRRKRRVIQCVFVLVIK